MTGGNGHTGAYISQMAMSQKMNELLSLEDREALQRSLKKDL